MECTKLRPASLDPISKGSLRTSCEDSRGVIGWWASLVTYILMLNHASDFARASTLDIQKPPNLTNALHSYLHNTCSESIWESHNSHRQVEPHGPRVAQCAALLKSCQSQCRLSPKDHPCTLDFRDFPPRWSECAESAQVLLSCLRIPPTRSAGSSLRIADANAFKEAHLGN